MNNLTQLGRQIAAIWKQLGLNQRISVVLAAAAVVAGLASLAWFSGRKDYSLLYGGLDEAEAGKVVAALVDSKTPYQIKGPGTIYVPMDMVYSTRMQLAAKSLPQSQGGGGYEILDKANFGISDFLQRANLTRALQGELARTISMLDQVESARVIIVMPENRLILDEKRKASASVFVKVRGSGDLPPSAVNSVQFIVSKAVEGLAAANVSVVDQRGNVLSENQDQSTAAGMSSSQFSARRQNEQYLTKQAETMLAKVLGPGNAVVRVAVDINWDSVTRTEEKFDPDGAVPKSETTDEEDVISNSTGGSGGSGAVGVASNLGTTNGASSSPLTSSNTKKKTTTRSYELNKTTSSTVVATGDLRKVSASVMLAQVFTGSGTNRVAVPRTASELTKLKQIVAKAINTPESEVVLEEIPFNEQPAMEIATTLEKQEKTQLYMDLGQRLLYPGVALVLGFMFFRTLKRTKSDDLPIGAAIGDLYPDGVGTDSMGLPFRKKKEEVVTVEVLNRLIRENPSSMTQAVRSWINRSETDPVQPPANNVK
jgi:flagellar M-ring protein FliF